MKTAKKALFIPLKTEHYNNFKLGLKTHEMRLAGKRWNRSVCFPGRKVVLSKGYGKHDRITGEIVSVEIFPAQELFADEYADFVDCYGEFDGVDGRMVIYMEISTDCYEQYRRYVNACHMEMQDPMPFNMWRQELSDG